MIRQLAYLLPFLLLSPISAEKAAPESSKSYGRTVPFKSVNRLGTGKFAALDDGCSSQGLKPCGPNNCIRLSYTCCPDRTGGCPIGWFCHLGDNGEYGCCPIGRRCRGDGGAVTNPGSIPTPSFKVIPPPSEPTFGSGSGSGSGSGGGDPRCKDPGNKVCGEFCAPLDSQCCPDGGGCERGSHCSRRSDGTYGCCDLGWDSVTNNNGGWVCCRRGRKACGNKCIRNSEYCTEVGSGSGSGGRDDDDDENDRDEDRSPAPTFSRDEPSARSTTEDLIPGIPSLMSSPTDASRPNQPSANDATVPTGLANDVTDNSNGNTSEASSSFKNVFCWSIMAAVAVGGILIL